MAESAFSNVLRTKIPSSTVTYTTGTSSPSNLKISLRSIKIDQNPP